MNSGNKKPSVIGFAAGASLTGGLIGAWEAAALVVLDAELTTSRPGAAALGLAAFAFGAAAVLAAASVFALARRTPAGRFAVGGRTDGVTFAVALALLFYAGYYLNAGILPAKSHPASLAADAALLALGWILIRFAPRLKIRRRWRVAAFAVLMAGAFLVATAAAGPPRRLGPPEAAAKKNAANFLLITMDTTRADRLGAYGGPGGLTPNLDKLAASAVVFKRAYCLMPLTGPSHAALFTGRTPRENGVVQNGVPLAPDAPTTAEVLRGRGYRTGAVVGAFTVSSKLGFARGFEYFDDAFSADAALSRLTATRVAASLGLVDAKARLQRPGDEVTRRAVRWLKDGRNRPFFLWVHYFDPHAPYEPPAEYQNLSDAADPQIRLYDGEVAFMDAEIGKLLAALDDAGLRENAVVVAVADHGESLGEHDYYYDHGRDVYEPSMRVPLLVAAPPGFPGLAVEHVGAEAARAEADVVTLESLSRFLLEGLAAYPSERPPPRKVIAPLAGGVAFGESLEDGSNRRMIVTQAEGRGPLYKLVLNADTNDVELYDLDADPGETHDLADARAETARAPWRRLRDYFASQPALPRGVPTDETRKKLRSLGYM